MARKVTSIRFSDAEREQIDAATRVSGRPFTQIVRACVHMAFAIPTLEEANLRDFQEIRGHLARVGNNLNQLARRANSGALVMSDDDREALDEGLELNRRLSRALDDYFRAARKRDVAAKIKDFAL